ncbi:helix-turn-helix transcriptional regulator [Cupriavidus necator]|jgi:transcriptional regulator with XRE-family HTH domain|uniref:helix-turn-helix domain-containing protein n=1 Tax=Cupriavidus necator TaxID=106590 RepID=UPI003ECE43AE
MRTKEPVTLFGRRLRQARRRADVPQDRLGVQIGIDELAASARISRYETGVHEPAFDIAVRLAEALQLPAAYFYCEDDDLAELVLTWKRLSKADRKDVKTLAESRLAAKHRTR